MVEEAVEALQVGQRAGGLVLVGDAAKDKLSLQALMSVLGSGQLLMDGIIGLAGHRSLAVGARLTVVEVGALCPVPQLSDLGLRFPKHDLKFRVPRLVFIDCLLERSDEVLSVREGMDAASYLLDGEGHDLVSEHPVVVAVGLVGVDVGRAHPGRVRSVVVADDPMTAVTAEDD